jgi:CCR4-NOT transcription complex subunit 7/8
VHQPLQVTLAPTLSSQQQQQLTSLVQTSRQQYAHLPTLYPLASSPINLLSTTGQNKIEIREVWAHNFYAEIKMLVELVKTYNYIAMDTEFPGVVVRPQMSYRNNNEYQYALIKSNADKLKLIQLGLSISDEQGNCLPDFCCWQFNFHFDVTQDQYAQDSLDLLIKSGIDFDKLAKFGIPWPLFGESMLTSGLLLNKNIHWLSFHSSYDFAYLARIFTNAPLPPLHTTFAQLLKVYCPIIYDIKYIMRCCDNLTGGLEKIGQSLKVARTGQQHQAGSDAMLTAAIFFKIRNVYFDGEIDNEKFCGIIYGLVSNTTPYSTPPHPLISGSNSNALTNSNNVAISVSSSTAPTR